MWVCDSQKSCVAVPAIEVYIECSQEDSWTLKSPQINGGIEPHLSRKLSRQESNVMSV